ncbi:triose-phosphate isomerase [Hufsiella ginkgonis]|uniref:Triosephosphate isomerase n=1 Tax=Hufsiella ginkgonis TaxID=2695274 RepID=A0A7K1XYY8_9SPHI|nr:triose-phosphate isomerase [Hufsiella ginkgonis]MXV15959.1 triose-phosphate isomerase [Hufsiella ginkgonis]
MRKKIVAGNWKMNLDHTAAQSLFSEIVNMVNDEVLGQQEVVVCPPSVHLYTLAQLAGKDAKVAIGAQNCHQAASGAFTGEISASMVKSTGASHVILGHSERRQYFGETDELLVLKVNTVLEAGLTPIFCIGETLEERNSGNHFDVISGQLKNGLFHLPAGSFGKVVLAYEPVWAIGTGLTASPEQAQEIHAFIRQQLADQYDATFAGCVSILYGGSCNAKNAPELFAQPDIDGGLIGGASLKSRDFTDIAKVFNHQ